MRRRWNQSALADVDWIYLGLALIAALPYIAVVIFAVHWAITTDNEVVKAVLLGAFLVAMSNRDNSMQEKP